MKKLIKEFYYFLYHGWKWIFLYHKFFKVGRHTKIIKPLFISGGNKVTIGDYVYIMNGLRIETISKWRGQKFEPEIKIGDFVQISQGAHIVATDHLIIEDYVGIGPYAMLNTANHSYLDLTAPIPTQNLESAPIRIGEGTNIGMGACILPGVSIGKHCSIGANTVISKDVPDYTIVSAVHPRKATLPV